MSQTWAYSNGTTFTSGGGTASAVVTAPSGIASGDLLFVFILYINSITATGWTQLNTTSQGGINGYWGFKVAGGSEPSTYTFTSGTGIFVVGIGHYTGLTSTPQDGTAHGTAVGTHTATAPSETTSAADDLCVNSAVADGGTSTFTFASGTRRIGAFDGAGDGGILYDQDIAAAGATGTNVATSNDATGPVCAFTGTFLQAAGGGGFDPSTVPWPVQDAIANVLAVVGF